MYSENNDSLYGIECDEMEYDEVVSSQDIRRDSYAQSFIKVLVEFKNLLNHKKTSQPNFNNTSHNLATFIEQVREFDVKYWFTRNPDHNQYNIFHYLSYIKVKSTEQKELNHFLLELYHTAIERREEELLFVKKDYNFNSFDQTKVTLLRPLEHACFHGAYYYIRAIIEVAIKQKETVSFADITMNKELPGKQEKPNIEIFKHNRKIANVIILDELLNQFDTIINKLDNANEFLNYLTELIASDELTLNSFTNKQFYDNAKRLPLLIQIINLANYSNTIDTVINFFTKIPKEKLQLFDKHLIERDFDGYKNDKGDNIVLYAAYHLCINDENAHKLALLFSILLDKFNYKAVNTETGANVLHKLFTNLRPNCIDIMQAITAKLALADVQELLTKNDKSKNNKSGKPPIEVCLLRLRYNQHANSPLKSINKKQYLLDMLSLIIQSYTAEPSFVSFCQNLFKPNSMIKQFLFNEGDFFNLKTADKILDIVNERLNSENKSPVTSNRGAVLPPPVPISAQQELFPISTHPDYAEIIKLITGKSQEHQQLTNEKEQWTKQSQQAEQEVKQLQQELAEKRDTITELINTKNELLDEVESGKKQHDELAENIQKLKTENIGLVESKSQLTLNHKFELSELNLSHKTLVNDKDSQIEDYERQLEQAKNAKNELEQTISSLRVELEITKNRIQQLATEFTEQKQRVEQAHKNQVAQLKEQFNQKATQVTELVTENSTLKQDKEDLIQTNIELKDKHTQQIKSKSTALQKLSSQNKQLTEQNLQAKEEITDLQIRLAQAEKIAEQYAQLQQQYKTLGNDQTNLKRKYQEVQDENNELTEGNKRFKLDNENLQKEATIFRRKLTLFDGIYQQFTHIENNQENEAITEEGISENGKKSQPEDLSFEIYFTPLDAAKQFQNQAVDNTNQSSSLPLQIVTGPRVLNSIGLWGEEAICLFLKEKYEIKYGQKAQEFLDGFQIIGYKKTFSEQMLPISIKIKFPNKGVYEKYLANQTDSVAKEPFDINIQKIVTGTKPEKWQTNSKDRIVEIKTTRYTEATTTITKRECLTLFENAVNHRLFRVKNAGKANATFTKIKDFSAQIKRGEYDLKLNF
jgi:chemotaxis protein histidine kinase CheA